MRREALACQGEDPEDPLALERAAVQRLLVGEGAEEADPAVRAAAHRVLLRLRAHAAAPAVALSLEGRREPEGQRGDPHPLVRVQAAATLRALAGEGAAPALVVALADGNRDVRLAAARELGRSGERSHATTEALIGALLDRAPEVRHHARRALRALHGVDLGLLPEAWEQWERQRQESLRASAPEPPAPAEGPR